MKVKDKHRFDIVALQDMVGAKVFARGEAYHRDGQVVILSIEPARVLAQVAGTEDYRTELRGRGKAIGGACSCPAFEDWGFCKHMVAVALAANAADGGAEAAGGRLVRIREYLKQRGVDALVTMILGLAERDPALFRRLDMAASSAHDDEKTLEARLRKAIDDATRTPKYVDYWEAPDWAGKVGAALDVIAELASGSRAGAAFRAAGRAIERIALALESMDDSDGHCSLLLERACGIHLTAAKAAAPEPLQLARDLFARELADEYGIFEGSAGRYAEALGKKGLAEYHRLAAEDWATLPPRGAERSRAEAPAAYDRLAGILDFFAERDGDVEARIALRAKNLSSPSSYLELAAFCRAQGREDEALRRAEEGLWVFEDDPNEPLLLFTVELLLKVGRGEDARAHLWRAFEGTPSRQVYVRLRELCGKPAYDRAVEFLQAHLVEEKPTGWSNPADFLIDIHLKEKAFDAAWSAAAKYGASMAAREILARSSEVTHPREALATYRERVDRLVAASSSAQ